MGKCNHGETNSEEGKLRMRSQCPTNILPDTEDTEDRVEEASQKLSSLELTDEEDPPAKTKDNGPHVNHPHHHQIKKRNSINQRTPSAWAVRGRQNSDRLRSLRSVVDKAIADHKIFSVVGAFPSVREALKQRGWLEKKTNPRPRVRKKTFGHKKSLARASTPSDLDVSDSLSSTFTPSMTSQTSNNNDDMLVARLLRQSPVDFFWNMRESIEWGELSKFQVVNRFPRAYFTTKVGLCNYMQQMHWYCEMGVSNILFPRCYNIGPGEEVSAFKYDFHLTACLSFLKWLVIQFEAGGEKAVESVEGRVPSSVVRFSLDRCNEFISKQSHEDIDQDDFVAVWDHQWDQFLTCYYMTLHGKEVIHKSYDSDVHNLYINAKETLDNIQKYWPQLELDGLLNIWIVKPGNKSRGRGIQLMNKLEDILARVNPHMSKESRYVVQKYIERPLLIYNTKFDIRQWFLVTCADPLTIWLYKESYLRFCSQTFSLQNMHESVHLCNNAVQCRYKNGKRDSPDLPDENMWDCYSFQAYLRTIGKADMWEKRIYPGMREGIIGALLASQEHMDRRSNCFELFGADFMLTEDFSPWLIEINSCPCMAPSTSVTARMCAQCLEDVIKVVVDKRHNKRANTGMFELVYKQQIPPAPPYLGMSLAVRGKKIYRDNNTTKNPKKAKRERSDDRSSVSSHSETKDRIKRFGAPIIAGLIDSLAHNLDQALSEFENSSDEEDLQPKPRNLNQGKTGTLKKKVKKGPPKRPLKNTNKKTKDKETGRATTKLKNDTAERVHVDREIEERIIEPIPVEGEMVATSEVVQYKMLDLPDKIWLNPVIKYDSATSLDKQMNLDCDDSKISGKVAECTSSGYIDRYEQAQASCSELSANIKPRREVIELKSNYGTIDKGINWETSNKPTIRDIVNKLAESQPEREFFLYTRGQGLLNSFSGARLFGSKEKLNVKLEAKRLQSPLNVLTANEFLANRADKNGKSVGQRMRVNPQMHPSLIDRNTQSRSGLPAIRQKSKPNTHTDAQNNSKLENFYAIGMSLKSMQNSLKNMKSNLNQTENLLLPLGSVSSLDVNIATAKPSAERFQ